jgi:hypothetical protein
MNFLYNDDFSGLVLWCLYSTLFSWAIWQEVLNFNFVKSIYRIFLITLFFCLFHCQIVGDIIWQFFFTKNLPPLLLPIGWVSLFLLTFLDSWLTVNAKKEEIVALRKIFWIFALTFIFARCVLHQVAVEAKEWILHFEKGKYTEISEKEKLLAFEKNRADKIEKQMEEPDLELSELQLELEIREATTKQLLQKLRRLQSEKNDTTITGAN